MDIAGLSLTESDGLVFLRGQPSQERTALGESDLRALLEANGYAGCVIAEADLAAALEDCNTKQTPFVVQLAQRINSRIEVEVTPDGMAAAVSLSAPQGGKAATIEDVIQALSDAGVTFGIDHAALLDACNVGVVSQLHVARGQAAEDGLDADFQEIAVTLADRAPKLDADGLIDYREHGAIALVEPGTPLMRRIPATLGVEGRDIRGQVLTPRPGRDEPFAAELVGATVDADDPNLLKATLAGQPVRVPCGVQVEPVLRVAEVNLATGNIYFDGTVEVEGDVNNTMKVRASGDILVGGTVEGADLEAGGDILIKGGVIAHAHVRAKGAVTARFAEGAKVQAGTTIALDDMSLESTLVAGNQIVIGSKAPQRGRLSGGSAQTMMLLRVPNLGSTHAALTQVVVGASPELEARYHVLQERIAKEKANEDNMKKLVHHLTTIGDPKGMLDKVKASWRQAVQVWGKSLAERGELDKELAFTRNAKVELGVETQGTVDMAFGSKKLRLRKQYQKGTFSVDKDSRVVFTDPSGQATPLG